MQCLLWVIYQNWRGLGLTYGSLFTNLSMDKLSMSYLFFFSRYQTKCVIKFLFRQFMMSQILRFIFNHPVKQWLTGRKKGKMGIQKCEYLENEKSFLDEIKSIFQSFWRTIIWWKKKKKIAHTSFQTKQNQTYTTSSTRKLSILVT